MMIDKIKKYLKGGDDVIYLPMLTHQIKVGDSVRIRNPDCSPFTSSAGKTVEIIGRVKKIQYHELRKLRVWTQEELYNSEST